MLILVYYDSCYWNFTFQNFNWNSCLHLCRPQFCRDVQKKLQDVCTAVETGDDIGFVIVWVAALFRRRSAAGGALRSVGHAVYNWYKRIDEAGGGGLDKDHSKYNVE